MGKPDHMASRDHAPTTCVESRRDGERFGRTYGVAVAPCKSCPYRTDVPSGVWAAAEYAKLPCYDGPIGDQALSGAHALFLCHQRDNNLCAGWIAAHGPGNLLALRLHGRDVAPQVFDYATRVPVFATGALAAAHGMAEIARPGHLAVRMSKRLAGKIASLFARDPSTPGDKSREAK